MSQSSERYVFIDAMRGIAAIWVVFHHAMVLTPLGLPLARFLPFALGSILRNGNLGVQIFFVISGFVIAHSLRATKVTGAEIARFILRRQLRLDPPYWAMMAVTAVLVLLSRWAPGMASRIPLDGWTLAANALYLQNLLGKHPILDVGWTLCLEIQFYLLFIMMLAIGRVAGVKAVKPMLVLGLGLASQFGLGGVTVGGFLYVHVIAFWWYFAAGALCYWSLQSEIRSSTFAVFIACVLVSWVWHGYPPALMVGIATALAFYGIGRAGRLTTWLSGRPFQYLGRISYSIYLVHVAVLLMVMKTGYRLTRDNGPAAVGWLVLATLASIGCAHVLHVLIEAPSMRWGARIRKVRTVESDPARLGDLASPAASATLQPVG